MKGTPHLLTDVKFDERRKGYDPEQVDNFLERVSGAVAQLQDKLREATSRAEEADARIAEAKRAQDVAEARVGKLKADLERTQAVPAVAVGAEAVAADPAAVAEEATNVLVMAQKAADATAAEARQQAMTTISDARTKAASIVAEAESQAEQVMAEAKRRSSELLDAQSAVILEEARSLESTRDRLKQDVTALHEHFDVQRDELRRHVERLLAVLDGDSEAGGQRPTLPDLSDATVGDFASVSTELVDEAPSTTSADRQSDDAESSESSDAVGELAAGADAAGPDEASNNGEEVTGADEADVAGDGDGDEPGSHDDQQVTGSREAESEVESETETGDGGSSALNLELDEASPAASSLDLDLTTERLFGAKDPHDKTDPPDDLRMSGGPPTELFTSISSEAAPVVARSPMGRPDARADEAMRAFFEADFDKPITPESKARFGRRR